MNESAHDVAGTRRVARGGIANLIGAAYSGIASFAITAVVTRISSTQDAGIYFSALSIMLIAVALAQIGTPVGYVYLLARYRGLGFTERLRSVLTAGTVPVLILASVLITVTLVFRERIGSLLFGDKVKESGTIVAIIAGVLLIAIAAEGSLAATRGLGVMKPTVVVDKFINPTTQLLALVLLAVAGWTGSEELILTRVAGFAAAAIIALPWLVKRLRRFPTPEWQSFRDTWVPRTETTREFWKFTGPRALGHLAQVGIQRVDIVLVALWLSPSQAAIYAAATRFLVFGQLAGRSISLAVQPQISTLAARGEMGALQHLYRTSTAWIMLATWPVYLTFLVHADLLMRVFGPGYASGAPVLRVLSATMLIATACGAVDAVLLMAGRSDLTMINAWVALAVNLGLNIWLIPRLGILGAAFAWVASILATNLVPLIQVRATLRVHPFGRTTVKAAVVASVLFGLIPWSIALAEGGIPGAIASLVIACFVYVAVAWRWREALGMTGLLGRRSVHGRPARNAPTGEGQ